MINAQVLTVNTEQPLAEAILIRDHRIAAIGSEESVLSQASSAARVIDLKGRAVVPGFIDAHSHFPVSGLSAVSVNLAPPPVGPGRSKSAVLNQIAESVPKQPAEEDASFVLGFNYDNTAFDEPVHPTRSELDTVSNGYPVYLWHSSGHLGVANSAALKRLQIDESTEGVEGGERVKDENGKLTGLLLEKAAPSLATSINQLSWLDRWKIVSAAKQEYLAAGITQLQNGYASMAMHRLLISLRYVGFLPQQVKTWLAHDKLDPSAVQHFPPNTTIKIIVDGSPQGLTAYLSKPYLVPAFGPKNAGLPLYRQRELNALVVRYHRLGYQLALHGNGDAAIEQIISAVEAAQLALPRKDARHLLVHAQMLRPDQMQRMAAIGLSPTFFTAHTFFWGDWHLQTLGEARAAGLSPAATAEKNGLRFSLHADTPVTPMSVLTMMWAASERQTRSGAVLGDAERIDRATALKAVTLDAAWQAFKEHEVGSLEVGKLADLVVLSENPITAMDIRQVVVDQTWIGGQRYF